MEKQELAAGETRTIGYSQEVGAMDNFKEGVLTVTENEESGTILPGDTLAEKLAAYEKMLDNAPRKFRRKFLNQKFSDRFKRHAGTHAK